MFGRMADRFADWLASTRALVQGVLLVILWVPFIVLGYDWHGLWLLAVLTVGSWVTQFPLARKADKADRHAQLLLKNLNDTMRLLVAMAEKQEDQLEEIHDAADKAASGAMARAAVVTARAAAAAADAYAKTLELGVESDLPVQAAVARED